MLLKSKKNKVRPNQQCPCGSGQKFKKCCSGELDWSTIFARKVDPKQYYSARGRNLVFRDKLCELLQLESEKQIDASKVKKAITPNFVREVYDNITKIWPPDTDLEWVYSRSRSSVAGLYIGDYELGYLERAVVRHSLYADKILLNDPFMNPHVISPKVNPLIHPERHQTQTLKNLNRFIALLPWVEAGIVDFIHTPADIDRRFGFDTRSRAIQEKQDERANEELQKSLVEARKRHKASGGELRTLIQLPDHQVGKVFDQVFPDGTQRQKQEFLQEVHRVREMDPNFLNTLDELGGEQYTIWSTGGTIENAHLTASMANAYIFTDIGYRWHKLQETRSKFSPETSVWSPFSKAVQNARFSFLNNLNLEVALKLRRENRLEGVRRVMASAFKSSVENDQFSDQHAVRLAENLNHEISKASNEWQEIQAELTKIGTAGATTNMLAAGPLIANGHGLWVAGASVIAGAGTSVYGGIRYKQYQSRFPASFFIGLKD